MGFQSCESLMNLERRLGFTSSFNLIPEGDYTVDRATRDMLTGNGFEVGVHDLRHDGKLYRNKDEFVKNAHRINGYLRDWGAVGFRSGFMLHNLDWLHQLDIQYDASTFDTDPFEPQPQGRHTIFPFWVRRPENERGVGGGNGAKPGYIELPYTLPQDSTLFLLLGERHPDIWMQKVDWVAKHGGMVLLDTHPDYIQFGKEHKPYAYPSAFYEELLSYIRSRYDGKFWHTTPRKLAQWFSQTNPCPSEGTAGSKAAAPGRKPLTGKRASVLLYSYYPSDPRPRREAEALAAAGMQVDLICLREDDEQPKFETINGVNVRRVPLQRRREGKLTYMAQYGAFLSICGSILAGRSVKNKPHLVHVHNMPDVLAFSALMPKLRGARVILDLHDPMPELMRAIFGMSEDSTSVRLLKFLEKQSVGFADQVITVNDACKKIFSARSCRAEKILVIMNAPDENTFRFEPAQLAAARNGKPFVIMFHGSIVERHGLDLAVKAVKAMRQRIPESNAQLRIYGTPTKFLDVVLNLVREEGLSDAVTYHGPKDLNGVTQAIRDCDVGIIPNRRSIFTEINTPTRIFEYLALGKPVIAPRASGITDYFKEDEIFFFELGDAEDLAKRMEEVYRDPARMSEVTRKGQQVYQKHTWTCERERFVTRVVELLAPK